MPLACMLFLIVLFWYLTVRICLDFTSRVWREKLAAERALRQSTEKANQAKTEFLANMSHEIRAPLNAISHFTQLAPRTPLGNDLQRHLGTVCTSAQWLIHIFNDLLEFSRSEAGILRLKNEVFSVRECVTAALQMIRPQAEARGLLLRSTVDADIPTQLRGDFTRLLQVIFNLAENAVGCTTAGGVMVTVEPGARVGGDITLRFSVTDTGVGIPDEQLKNFFKPLTHPSASYQSGDDTKRWMTSAFGLAICEKIVSMMGGSMEAQSHIGAGTTVRFTAQFQMLPAFKVAQPVQSAPEHAACSAARSLTVLLADENAISRRLAKVLMEAAGHTVHEASSGSEVFTLFSHGPFDLVLLDLEMAAPSDGVEVTRAIRAGETLDSRTPIYALICSAATADREACRSAGIDGFLSKPVEIDAVLNIVAAIASRPLPPRGGAYSRNSTIVAPAPPSA